jgi:hypothetical protein
MATTTLRKSITLPCAVAVAAAAVMATVVVVGRMTGFQGKFRTRGTPVPFGEAWTNVPDLAGIVFVVTFLVLAIWGKVRSRR